MSQDFASSFVTVASTPQVAVQIAAARWKNQAGFNLKIQSSSPCLSRKSRHIFILADTARREVWTVHSDRFSSVGGQKNRFRVSMISREVA
jgi:hypothetical protein